jgi:hypothetical protein
MRGGGATAAAPSTAAGAGLWTHPGFAALRITARRSLAKGAFPLRQRGCCSHNQMQLSGPTPRHAPPIFSATAPTTNPEVESRTMKLPPARTLLYVNSWERESGRRWLHAHTT